MSFLLPPRWMLCLPLGNVRAILNLLVRNALVVTISERDEQVKEKEKRSRVRKLDLANAFPAASA